MSQSRQTTGLVLRTAASGESFLKIELLCPENGICFCLKRISKKNPLKESPDLFDTADLTLENSKQGSLQFIGEYRVTLRRETIGLSYHSLKYASDFCAIIAENGPHMAEPELLYALTERTLDAFAAQKAPAIVFLKALYLLLKDEGYPIKETWWGHLSHDLKPIARDLLKQPAPEKIDTEMRETLDRINHSLCRWLRNETDLRLPASIQV